RKRRVRLHRDGPAAAAGAHAGPARRPGPGPPPRRRRPPYRTRPFFDRPLQQRLECRAAPRHRPGHDPAGVSMKLNEVEAAANVAAAMAAKAAAGAASHAAAAGARRRIAIISEHASPLAAPGSVDCGGQNVYVAQLARELARAGHLVDVFTRRDAPGQRQLLHWLDNIRVVHVPAGPPRYVPKEQMLPHVDAFARYVTRFA